MERSELKEQLSKADGMEKKGCLLWNEIHAALEGPPAHNPQQERAGSSPPTHPAVKRRKKTINFISFHFIPLILFLCLICGGMIVDGREMKHEMNAVCSPAALPLNELPIHFLCFIN